MVEVMPNGSIAQPELEMGKNVAFTFFYWAKKFASKMKKIIFLNMAIITSFVLELKCFDLLWFIVQVQFQPLVAEYELF